METKSRRSGVGTLVYWQYRSTWNNQTVGSLEAKRGKSILRVRGREESSEWEGLMFDRGGGGPKILGWAEGGVGG